MTVKQRSNTKIDNINPLYFIVNKINEYIEVISGNEYLTLVTVDESKDTLKRYEELWNKIRDLIRSITNKLGNYNSDDNFPLNNTLELHNMVIVLRAVFHEGNKYYPQNTIQ